MLDKYKALYLCIKKNASQNNGILVSGNGGTAPIGPNCLQITNMNSGENVTTQRTNESRQKLDNSLHLEGRNSIGNVSHLFSTFYLKADPSPHQMEWLKLGQKIHSPPGLRRASSAKPWPPREGKHCQGEPCSILWLTDYWHSPTVIFDIRKKNSP